MMIPGVEIQAVGAIVTISVVVAGVVFMVLRSRLSADFVTRGEYREMIRRLDAVEERMRSMPTHDDFNVLAERIAGVAREVAVVNAFVSGLRDSTGRIEHQLDMLMQAYLEREKS